LDSPGWKELRRKSIRAQLYLLGVVVLVLLAGFIFNGVGTAAVVFVLAAVLAAFGVYLWYAVRWFRRFKASQEQEQAGNRS